MAYGESKDHVTLKGKTCDPNIFRAQYRKQLEMQYSRLS